MNKYVSWSASWLPHRDALRVAGTPAEGSVPWVVEIDGLLAGCLGPTSLDSTRLLRLCEHAAEAGMPPDEFVTYLQQKVAHDQQQRLATMLGQQNITSQQQLNQQQMNAIQAQHYQQQQYQHYNTRSGFPASPGLSQGLSYFPQGAAPNAALWENPQRVETELLAYRGWKLDLEYTGLSDDRVVCDIVLRSVSRSTKWPGPVLRADRQPAALNDYGIYAVGTEDRHVGNFNGYVLGAPVWGEVSLSGLVVEGMQGYRAEVCTIRSLWLHPCEGVQFGVVPLSALARILAHRYQVDTPTVRAPNFAWLRELERARKDRDAMFTQATGTFPP